MQLVAFLREEEQERFYASWDSVYARGTIQVQLTSNAIDYTQLGVFALEATGASLVCCFGGGAVVEVTLFLSFSEVQTVRERTHDISPFVFYM